MPTVVAGLTITLAALAVYHNSLSAPFNFDDIVAIVENPSIRRLWPIWDVLSPARASGVTTSGRPLLNLSLTINHALGGMAVWGYHGFNLGIHICAGLTLFGIVRRTLHRPVVPERFGAVATPLATAVAVLWTIHPLQTESVTYVVQRAESLMGLFYLLTMYCFIRGIESPSSGRWFSLSVAACLAGMATKEVMVTAPMMVFLYDRTFVAGTFSEAWKRRWRLYIGLVSTWLLLGYLVVGMGNRAGTAGFGTHVRWWEYALTQCWAIPHYLRLSVWPHPLIIDYGMWLARSLTEVASSAFILAMLLTGVIIALRRWPLIGFLGGWFFVILAPSSSVVPVVSQTVAEHRMYLPLAAVVALVVVGGYAWLRRRGIGPFLALAVMLGVVTWQRNADYRDSVVMWADTVAKRPGNLRAHYSLGIALEQSGRIEEAITCYEQVLRMDPDYAEAHNRLGNSLTQVGKPNDAIGHFQCALRIKPDYPEAHNNLGVALERSGRIQEAISQFEQALQLKPDFADAHFNLGIALAQTDNIQEAIRHYEQALMLKPDHADAHNNLGSALVQLGRVQEAFGHWEQALRINPQLAEAHNNWGTALMQQGRISEAIQHYQQALQLKPDYAKAHYNWGIASERAGEVQAAIEHFKRAVNIKPDFIEAHDELTRLREAP